MRFLSVVMVLCSMGLASYWWMQRDQAMAEPSTSLPDVTIQHFSIAQSVNEPTQRPPQDQDESWKTQGQGFGEKVSQPVDNGLNTPIAEDAAQCLIIGPIKETRLPEFRAPMEKLGLLDKAYIEKVLTEDQYWVYAGPYKDQQQAQEQAQLIGKSFSDIKVERYENGGWAVFMRTFKDEFAARSWMQQASVMLAGPRLGIYRPPVVDNHLVNIIFNQVHHEVAKHVKELGQLMKEKVDKCSED